jgi:hypothetical protein
MQQFCEPLKSGPHEAIFREIDANGPKSGPSNGSGRLKMAAPGSN